MAVDAARPQGTSRGGGSGGPPAAAPSASLWTRLVAFYHGVIAEIKNGKKVTVERKLYPGYVLVEMDMNQETAHVINGIQGVIKFVGHDQRFPQPLRPDEVNRLLGIVDDAEEEAPREEIPFMIGQAVAITEGPFTDFNGTVEEVMADKGKVRVSVSLFGRTTSVELDYLQLRAY